MYAGRQFTVIDNTGQAERQRQIDGDKRSKVTDLPKSKRSIALRDAVGLALVVLGICGLVVACAVLMGLWGAVLVASVASIGSGIALGMT